MKTTTAHNLTGNEMKSLWLTRTMLMVPLLIMCLNVTALAHAASADPASNEIAGTEAWAVHGQFTYVTQHHSGFFAPYSGDNSLAPSRDTEETTDLTLFAGRRLGRHTEFWINPEIDQGFGLSNTLGVAGFPSGEAYKVGANAPYLRLPRAFVRHVIPLGGAEEKVDAAANQLGGTRASDNLTLTIGKFSVVDIFDTNSYAHDPRADFLNWAIIDAGAFDYAADAWGFTYGAAAEWTQGGWTLRTGAFQMSEVPNAKVAGLHPHQHMVVGELETRHVVAGHPGKVKLLAFVNRADMANYRDALQLATKTGGAPDVSRARRFQSRPGIVLNVEQELADDLGAFARVSANDGGKEAYEFTEINRSIAVGAAMKGTRWGRADDTVGVAAAVNGLSGAAQEYFSAGGMGILIGDGHLNYGTEQIVETYYSLRVNRYCTLALNYQHVNNPAYNRDRGPVSIYGMRLHGEF